MTKMKTNFKAFQEIKQHYDFYKDQIRWGLMAEREADLIKAELDLENKNLLELQNARDFAACYFANLAEHDEANQSRIMDMMSAIVYVIDCEKLTKGGKV